MEAGSLDPAFFCLFRAGAAELESRQTNVLNRYRIGHQTGAFTQYSK